jgi:hypothetical protein
MSGMSVSASSQRGMTKEMLGVADMGARGEGLAFHEISFFTNLDCSGATIVVPTCWATAYEIGTAIAAPLYFLNEFI